MENPNSLVKQDINFLENPIWFQNEVLANQKDTGIVWKDKEGYVYRTSYKIPVKTDIIFLLCLMLKSQQNGWTEELELTRYEILKDCKVLPVSKAKYDRLEDSLKRWKNVNIEFKGTFYDKKEYLTMNFGIINTWKIEKSKKLKIEFNREWLLKVKNSTFFKMLDFEMIKNLRSPLIIRLYEVLAKTFQGRSEWQIDAIKLAQKIPMAEQHASHIRIKIEAAVRRIHDKTNLKVSVKSVKQGRGKILFIFSIKTDKNQVSTDSQEPSKQELEDKLKALKLTRKQIVVIIKNYEPDQIRRNIDMTLKKAANGDVRNIPAFFTEAVREDYAKDYIPVDEKHQELVSEAKKCWQKTKGSCVATWKKYKDNKSHACHWCKKFAEQRKKLVNSDVAEAEKEKPVSSAEPLYNLIPVKITKPIRSLITKYCQTKDPDYVRKNIEHTNQNIKDKRKYRAFLEKSLTENQADAENKQEENDNRFEQLKSAFADLSSDQQESVKSAFFDYLKAKGSASILIKTYRKKGIDSVIIQPVWEEYLEKTLDI